MNNRYTKEASDLFALKLQAFASDPYSGMACAGFMRPEDRCCDVVRHLSNNGAAVFAAEERQSCTRAMILSVEHSTTLLLAEVQFPLRPNSAADRLASFLGAIPAKFLVFGDAHLLSKQQFRVMNRALSILAAKQSKKKILLLIEGKSADFDSILQSYDQGWAMQTCPKVTEQDVHTLFAQTKIPINGAAAAKFLKFAHSAPQRLILLRQRAQNMGLMAIDATTALPLIENLDSQGLKRPMTQSIVFLKIGVVKPRSKPKSKGAHQDDPSLPLGDG